MSVFTAVTPEELSVWLTRYAIGSLTDLRGIAAGIENTNYFVTTTHGRYVLTLFENLNAGELPFFFNLMSHLAQRGIPCPQPIATVNNEYVGELKGKPAGIVTYVPGADLREVEVSHCAIIGALLGEMHIACASYPARLPNPRGPHWWQTVLPRVLPFLAAADATLLSAEVHYQSQVRRDDLPCGVIHADLFRENVLWNGMRVGGIIDFYFACYDILLYDVAIVVNDWCVAADGSLSMERARALLNAYCRTRPVITAERLAWPAMLRAGALRFWVSRLHDLHLPRPGVLTHAKDPRAFQRVLEQHMANEANLKAVLP